MSKHIERYDGLVLVKVGESVRERQYNPCADRSEEVIAPNLSGSVEFMSPEGRIVISISGRRIPKELDAGKVYRVTIKAQRPKKSGTA